MGGRRRGQRRRERGGRRRGGLRGRKSFQVPRLLLNERKNKEKGEGDRSKRMRERDGGKKEDGKRILPGRLLSKSYTSSFLRDHEFFRTTPPE
jgi:hypothetical protein